MLKLSVVPLSSRGKKGVGYITCYKLDRVGHGDDIIKCVERWIKAVDSLEQNEDDVYRAVKWVQGSLECPFNSDETSAVWEKQVKG